jgi:hypothetical protein
VLLLLPFSFFYFYIASLGVHGIQLRLAPDTSFATFSNTFAQNPTGP